MYKKEKQTEPQPYTTLDTLDASTELDRSEMMVKYVTFGSYQIPKIKLHRQDHEFTT